jgi:uncharacterized secreted repeat protein (TIGR03808 family)
MPIDRRRLLVGLSTSAAVLAAPLSAFGLDAAQFGVRAGSLDDQSRALQRAIDQAAHARVPLMLAPGVYRAGDLKLPAGAHLVGMSGATRLILTRGPSLLSAEHADSVVLSGLTLDGGNQLLAQGRGLIHFNTTKAVRITDCQITDAGGNGVTLEECGGDVTNSTITGAADNALFCIDSRGFRIVGNIIAKSGNGGIRVWQSVKRHDGSLVADNRIDDTGARAGGDGENGNAINIFRAADVMVRSNQIRNAAFSAVRGNATSNFQVIGNNCAELDETAMYAEFGFEGAIFADNVIDGAENGIAVTNFDHGGRLGTVRGNLVRNVRPRRPGTGADGGGLGIAVEADSAVTGNVVENATRAGIRAGWGPYLRNVAVTGNVVRNAGYGIAVSVVSGAGAATITGNLLEGAKRGAIVGMEWNKAVTGDLAKEGAVRYPQLTIANNRVR